MPVPEATCKRTPVNVAAAWSAEGGDVLPEGARGGERTAAQGLFRGPLVNKLIYSQFLDHCSKIHAITTS